MHDNGKVFPNIYIYIYSSMIEIEMLNFINCIFLNVEYKKSSFVHLRAQIK